MYLVTDIYFATIALSRSDYMLSSQEAGTILVVLMAGLYSNSALGCVVYGLRQAILLG